MKNSQLNRKEIQNLMKVIENCKDAYLNIFEKEGVNPQALQEYNWLSDKWLELYELQSPLLNK